MSDGLPTALRSRRGAISRGRAGLVRHARGELPWWISGLSMVLGVLAVLLYLENRTGTARSFDFVAVGATLPLAAVGTVLASARKGERIGWLLLAAAASLSLHAFSEQYATYALMNRPGTVPGGVLAAWVDTWVWAPGFLGMRTIVILLFPDGRPPSPHLRPLLWGAGAAIGMTIISSALVPGQLPGYPVDNPLGIAALPWLSEVSQFMAALCVVGLGPACLAGFATRMRGERQAWQLRWFLASSILVLVTPVAGILVPARLLSLGTYQAFGLLALSMLPLTILFALLKPESDLGGFEVNRLTTRLLLHNAVVFALAVAFWFSITVLQLSALGAVVVVGAGFHPVRSVLRRAVNLLRRPSVAAAAVQDLGHRLQHTLAPDEVLPKIADVLEEHLKPSYVAITLGDEEDATAVEVRGEPQRPEHLEVFRLVHAGDKVGHLTLAPRHPGQQLSSEERGLLILLVRQVSVAAYGVRATENLKRSKERLVTTREEERRRWRNEHHDRIRPALGGIINRLEAARLTLERDGSLAQGRLSEIKADVQSAYLDVERVGKELGPGTVDELGLIGAVRHHASKLALSSSTLSITVKAPQEFRGLPTEVEVAAFLIICEALENVRKYAHADRVTVSLRVGDDLEVEVSDNGRGFATDWKPGVGLCSMQERAADLNGQCWVGPGIVKGIVVRARLPLIP